MSDSQLSMFEDRRSEPAARKAKTIQLARTINASPQQVFDQWLIPVFVGDWMFDSSGSNERALELNNEVRKGGGFRFRVQRQGKQITYSGVYEKLEIPQQLVFTWIDSETPDATCQVTARFEAADNKTRLKLSVRVPAALSDQHDRLKRRWTSRCSALATKFRPRKAG